MSKKDYMIENISDAFLALSDIEDEEVENMLKPKAKMTEGRTYSVVGVGNSDLEEAAQFLHEKNEEIEIEVIDPDADVVEHIKNNSDYIGQAILQCNRCRENRFMDMDLLVGDAEDPELYNVEDECPHCKAAGSGYILIGQVGRVAAEEPVEDLPLVSNDEKDENEPAFENDLEDDTTEDALENEPEDLPEPDEKKLVLDLDDEKDGMQTTAHEDDDLIETPKLGDLYKEEFSNKDDDKVSEGFNRAVGISEANGNNKLAHEAWMMNQVIEAMNNEEAYYASWVYIWPDEMTREECEYEFSDEEAFEELKDEFIDTYKAYHADGLYTNVPETIDYAHKWDQILNLSPIVNYMHESLEEENPTEPEYLEEKIFTVRDLLNKIIESEDLEKVQISDFNGPVADVPAELLDSPLTHFNVNDGNFVINVSEPAEDKFTVAKLLSFFNDGENDKLSLVNTATSEELISGTAAEILDNFADYIVDGIEKPELLNINVIEEQSVEESLFEEICRANNLHSYKADRDGSEEFWLKESLENGDAQDLQEVYDKYCTGLLAVKFRQTYPVVESVVNEGGFTEKEFNKLQEYAHALGLGDSFLAIDNYMREHDCHNVAEVINAMELELMQKELLAAANETPEKLVCPNCGKELNDGGTCPVCDDNEEDLDENCVKESCRCHESLEVTDPAVKALADNLKNIKYIEDLLVEEITSDYVLFKSVVKCTGYTAESELVDGEININSLDSDTDDIDIDLSAVDIKEAVEKTNAEIKDSGVQFDANADFELDVDDCEAQEVDDYDIISEDDGIGSYDYMGSQEYDSRPHTLAVDVHWSGVADVSFVVSYIEKEEPAETNEGCRSFKSRKELAEAIEDCKKNNRPYSVKRSTKDGYRFDLFIEPVASNAVITEDDNELAPVEAPVEVVPDDAIEIIDTPKAAETTEIASPLSLKEIEVLSKINRIANDICDAVKKYYDVDAKPALVVADILQDLRLISGAIDVKDLEDNPINNATKEMFNDYNQVYEVVDAIMSELSGEDFHTTPEEKLEQALNTLDSHAFDPEMIDKGISSERFASALEHGAVPYIAHDAANQITESLDENKTYNLNDINQFADVVNYIIEKFIDKNPWDFLFFEDVPVKYGRGEKTINVDVSLDDFENEIVADIENIFKKHFTDDINNWNVTKSSIDALADEFYAINDAINSTDSKYYDIVLDLAQKEADSIDESIEVDVSLFDTDMNEYFKTAYDEHVAYKTTNGSVDANGNIILEGLIGQDGVNKKVTFTLAPITPLNESLDTAEDVAKALNDLTYKVTNDLSEEVFEFKFENDTPNEEIFEMKDAEKLAIINDYVKSCSEYNTECKKYLNVRELIKAAAEWAYSENQEYKKLGLDASHIENFLISVMDQIDFEKLIENAEPEDK